MSSVCSLVAIACFVSVAVSVADMICPEKKFDKQLKVIFSLLFVIASVSPFIKGTITFEFPDISDISVNKSIDYIEYTDELIKEIENNVAQGLKNELSEKNLYIKEIYASVNISDNNSISISKVVFYPKNDDDGEKIQNEIKNILGKDTEIIRGT